MGKSSLRRLVSAVSSLDGQLPYNWNWQRTWQEVAPFLSEHPIVLFDVGARGEAPPELDSLLRHVRRIGFEPDEEECYRLNQTAGGDFFPLFLAGERGKAQLHLYRDLGYSSSYRLTDRYQRLWIGALPINRTVTLDATTLDAFHAEHPDLRPDLLKLDTQGSELNILQGARRTLAAVGLVEVEVEFVSMYDGQPLFHDVSRFMSEQGYELLYLNRVLVNRSQVYQGPSRGQLLFGDALFGRHEDSLGDMTEEQVAKYCILLCQYGHRDIAWQLFQADPRMSRVIPELRSIFVGHRNPLWRGAVMQLDKVIAFALHLRRYNQRGTDSDRCWPIR